MCRYSRLLVILTSIIFMGCAESGSADRDALIQVTLTVTGPEDEPLPKRQVLRQEIMEFSLVDVLLPSNTDVTLENYEVVNRVSYNWPSTLPSGIPVTVTEEMELVRVLGGANNIYKVIMGKEVLYGFHSDPKSALDLAMPFIRQDIRARVTSMGQRVSKPR